MDYGGDVSPEQCWEKLGAETGAVLVDVRTRAEWAYTGVPSLEPGMTALVGQEWQVFPDMQVDQNFVGSLKSKLDELGVKADTDICFLCRSGVRSLAAARAMTAAGYPNTFNVTDGFEGDLDSEAHRGQVNGWKVAGLPWQQR